MGGGFNEACVARALHTFELALLAPFIAEKVAEKKNFWKSVAVGVVAIVIITLIILFFDGHRVFGTIYVDYVMALLVVFLLMTILAPKRIGWFEILMIMVGGSFLLLLKQMGAPLYMMVICFLFGMLWLRKKQKLKEYLTSVGWKRVGLVLMMLLIPFVLWFVWNKMVDGQVQQFKLSDLNLAEFIKVLVGHGEPWQAETVNNYIAALGGSSITTSYIKISFLPTIALFVGGMWLVLRLSRKSLDGKEMVLAMVVILVGAIGYVVMMLLLYVLSFGEVEGPTLASYDRYMGTYAILMMVFVAMIVIWQGAIKSKRGLICVLTLIMILINLSNVNMYGLVFPDLRGRIFGSYTKYEEEAKRITNMVGDEAKVYLLMGEKSLAYGYEFFVQYYGNTIKFNYNNMDMVKYYGEEILSEIKNSDYLLVVEAEKSLEDKYCDELKVCPLGVGNMYKVLKKEDNTFKYELIGNIYNIDD